MSYEPPLTGLRVLELAGLAPGKMAPKSTFYTTKDIMLKSPHQVRFAGNC